VKRPLGNSRHKRRILKIDVKGTDYEDMDWIQLAHDASNVGYH
jgi:hypothetical protein